MTTAERLRAAAERLRAAANHISVYGWIQGARGSHGRATCVSGAIVAADRRAVTADELALARQFVERVDTVRHYDCVEDWNDAPVRTKDEVIAALERAAELADDEAVKS